jgi:hypothetical protein
MKKRTPIDMLAGCEHQTRNNGKLIVIEFINASNVIVRFTETSYTTSTHAAMIRRGEVKDKLSPVKNGVGFLGVGEYVPTVNGIPTPAYSHWAGMLRRCYDQKHQESSPTYIGCTVCDEWHNFQVFAEWYYLQEMYNEKWVHLDKDIKVKGNKVYSPSACKLVTAIENTVAASARSYKFTDPSGEVISVYNLSEFCRNQGLDTGHMAAVNNGTRKTHKKWTKA